MIKGHHMNQRMAPRNGVHTVYVGALMEPAAFGGTVGGARSPCFHWYAHNSTAARFVGQL